MDLRDRLHDIAIGRGAAGFGVCEVSPFFDVATELERRSESGMKATLGFTYGEPGTAANIALTYPWAASFVAVAHAYMPAAGAAPMTRLGVGTVARFATEDHYVLLRECLEAMAAELVSAGHHAAVMSDDARLVDRAVAVRAGVGWWGKSTMVLVPGSGPWVLLGSVVTSADLPRDVPMRRDCGTCTACLAACPTGALVAPGILDARLCLAHWLQAPGVIPRRLRAAVGGRFYGCDDCLDACPPGFPSTDAVVRRAGKVDLGEVLAADDATLVSRFSHFYIPGRRARYLRRNALIALTNTSREAAAPVLGGYAGHPDWLLRLHAVWGLGTLEVDVGRPLIDAAAGHERDRRVRAEIEAALGSGAGS